MTLEEADIEVLDCEHRTPPAALDGVPYIAIPQMKEGRLDPSNARLVAEQDVPIWNRRVTPREGDVIVSRRTNPGVTAVVPPDFRCVLGQNLVILRSRGTKVGQSYFRWLVRGPEWWQQIERNLNAGAVFDSLRCADIPRFELTFPPLDEQRVIAHILGTLDDKIELNRRMSETLETMARALFKSWFVDFDPVRAKAERRDPGLPKPLADLFPSCLVDSELGEIPEGWSVETLADHFDAVKGVSYKGSGLADSGIPLHNLNSIYEGGGYKYEGVKHYTGDYAERHLVQPGDVIVANTEQGHDRLLIGYAAIVPRLFGARGIASHHVYRVRPKPSSLLTGMFFCYLLNSPRMHDLVSGYANGTTVNMLPIDGLQKPRIVCPPRQLVLAFDSLASKVEQRREEMVSETRTLVTLRDALLPKLISCELRISDSDAILTRAEG